MSHSMNGVLGVVLVLGLAGAVVAQARPIHRSPHGFRIAIPTFPERWEPVPIKIGEQTIVAKFVSPKAYRAKKVARFEFMLEAHKPMLQVLVLPNAGPYASYHAYLQECSDVGFYLESEKPVDVGGVKAIALEYKHDVKTVVRRTLAWVFERDGTKYVVEFEVLEDYLRELRPYVEDIAETFRFETAAVSEAANAGAKPDAKAPETFDLDERAHRVAWYAKSAEERKAYRKGREQMALADARARVPKGWTKVETARLLVLSEHDPKITQRYVEEAEACFQWMEANFGGVNDEYVRRMILRLFASQGSYRAYNRESQGVWEREQAMDMHLDLRTGSESLGVASNVVRHFLREKIPVWGLTSWNAPFPTWLEAGFSTIRYADFVGGRVRLFTDANDVRDARRSNELVTARALMSMTDADFSGRGWGIEKFYRAQSVRLFLCMLEGGRRHPGLKGMLTRFLTVSAEEIERLEVEELAVVDRAETEAGEPPVSEREKAVEREDEHAQRASRHAELFKRINERLVGKWTDKQWKELEALYSEKLKAN